MKLYTEEQVKQVIATFTTQYFVSIDELLEDLKLAPIKLPSDEDIEKLGGSGMEDAYNAGLKHGALWMKQQILNQNK